MAERQHFDSLTIRGFRGLTDIDIRGLGEVNILLGANDVGKTSVLEAILLIANPAEPRLPIQVQNSRNYQVHEIDDLASVFLNLDFNREVVIDAVYSGHDDRRRLTISAPDKEYPIDAEKKPQGKLETRVRRELQYDLEAHTRLQETPKVFRTKLIDRGDKWAIDRTSLGDVVDEIAGSLTVPASFFIPRSDYKTERIGKLVVNKKDELLVEYLRHINPRVTKISAHKDVAYLDIGLAQMMPLNMFGGGMIRAASILSECVLSDAKVLLIDELEQGLHHQAISFLLEAILRLSREQGVQIFATTHSIEVIEGLQRVLGKKDFAEHRATTKCITLQRDKSGVVRTYKYDYSQFDHCIEHGIEIR